MTSPRVRLVLVSQRLAEGVPQHVLDPVSELDRDRYEIDVPASR